MSDGTSIATAIAISVDGHRLGRYPVVPGLSVIDLHARGRTVRVDIVRSTGGNTGAQEIRIYGR
jgi:hypothetical protein